jgi:beta-lactamase class A
MRLMLLCLSLFGMASVSRAQSGPAAPEQWRHDRELARALAGIVRDLGIDSVFDVGEDGTETISLAVVDLRAGAPRWAGVNADNFIYPASVYKMYAAMGALAAIEEGRFGLYDAYVLRAPNVRDGRSEIAHDPRPVLREGDTVTVDSLLDLTISRSDNTAANCVIDLASRPFINSLMHRYGWQGSEVTRKFLSRRFEDPGYDTIRGTETSALHAADFMVRIEQNRLVSQWVSLRLKSYLGRQLDTSKLAAGLPATAMFYHKTGWYSYWTNDVGIVQDDRVHYVIACFLPLPEERALPILRELSRRVYAFMAQRD